MFSMLSKSRSDWITGVWDIGALGFVIWTQVLYKTICGVGFDSKEERYGKSLAIIYSTNGVLINLDFESFSQIWSTCSTLKLICCDIVYQTYINLKLYLDMSYKLNCSIDAKTSWKQRWWKITRLSIYI